MKSIAFLLLLLPLGIIGQNRQAETQTRFFGTDVMGFEYFSNDGALYKIRDGQRVQYQNFGMGAVHRLDFQNPLRTLAFYRDFNACILLDSQFNEILRIDFNQWPEPLQPLALGLAAQNRLWVYDGLSLRIGLLNERQPATRFITQNLQDGLIYYQSDLNHFDWIDTQRRWFRVDLYGKITALGTLPEFTAVQLLESSAILLSDEKLWLWHASKQTAPLPIAVENSIRAFWWNGQNLAIFTDNGISNYKIHLR